MAKIQTVEKETLRQKLTKQKFGWFTLLFYGIGNVFWAFANNYRTIAGRAHSDVLQGSVSKVAGAFWITVIRESLYLLLFVLYAGPGLFKRRFKDTFTKGGQWMLLAVFVNFIGNVMLATGYVYLVNAAFSGSIATSFVVFTFVGAYIMFGTKVNKQTLLGMAAVIIILIGITTIQIYNSGGLKGADAIGMVIGSILIIGAQVGYMVKNIISEFVFKNKLLDVEGVQFMATFWSPFVALIGTIIFLPILQPILVLTGENSQNYAAIDGTPFMLLFWMLAQWQVIALVFVASIFLLSGRNSQYQMTRISGAALSNVFYQAKVIVQALGTLVAYVLLIAITNSSYPVNTDPLGNADPSLLPWDLITDSYLSLWYYWVLVFAQVAAVVYTVLAGQKYYEKEQKDYRKKRNIKDEEKDYSIKTKGISRATHKK